MNILLDNLIFSKSHNGGISNYWYELCRYMLQNHEERLRFFDYAGNFNYHRSKLEIPPNDIIACKKAHPLTVATPLRLRSSEHFIYHSSYYRALAGSPAMAEVTTVHDFTHDYCFSPLRRKLHNQIKYPAIKRAAGVICISHNTYTDMMRLCPPKRHQKVKVIYNGVSDDYFPIAKEESLLSQWNINPERPFLLYIGSRAPYKNFGFTLSVLKALPEYDLVAIGSPFTEKEKKAIGPELLQRIMLLTNVPDESLNILYNFAHALLYPSEYEGFGIPVIEAMKAGCPVLALDRSSIGEIASGHALLYGQAVTADFKSGIQQLNDTGFREQLTGAAMVHSRKFSWEKCARETYDFYSEVYKG